MKQVLQYPKRQGLAVAECSAPACKPGGILVDNRFSLISPGTERAVIELASQSLIGKARSRPDLVRQVIGKIKSEGLLPTLDKVRSRLKVPVPLGYSSCGLVAELGDGVHEFRVGDRVACAGFGYASHAERIFVPKNLAVALPRSMSFQEGAFVTLGSIALWGVRQSAAGLGDRVAVIGLGMLGQLTVQILKAAGCEVIGIDIAEERLTEASRFNLDLAVRSTDPVAEKAIWHYTSGLGVDAAIITAASRSNQPIEFAGSICRDRGRVTVVGDVKMDLPRQPFYNKELTLNLSRSYGPGRYDPDYEERGQDYPAGFVRWTENRNMQSFLDLVAARKVKVAPLVSATYPVAEAAEAFARIEAGNCLGVLLRYSAEIETNSVQTDTLTQGTGKSKLSIGFLGAGGFATGVLLPKLKQLKTVSLQALYSATPYKAKAAAEMFDFSTLAGSEEMLLSDETVDAVMIATPHNLHCDQVIASLQAGKHVFVEKPLCLTAAELSRIRAVWAVNGGTLMVGFNRRYAPATVKMRERLVRRRNPVIFNYVVNAGHIPRTSWIQDDKTGGGRIIGECCHFLDLLAYLACSRITEVQARSISQPQGNYLTDDNVVISAQLADGSCGTITYTALGDSCFPKETLTVFSDGRAFHLADFKLLELYEGGRRKTLYSGEMNKGIAAELEAFVDRCLKGQNAEETEGFFNSSLAAILAAGSLKTGTTATLASAATRFEMENANTLS